MRLVVGISGASGVIYGIRALEVARDLGIETHLVISKYGQATISLETDYSVSAVKALAHRVYSPDDLAAAIASGSFPTDGMMVCPCRSTPRPPLRTVFPTTSWCGRPT